jgi:carbonic anhydrase/acetyltransferase-like protein (isoleucine patch superfamily)
MNAVVMDNVLLGAECIVGALCFVPAEMKVEPRKVLVGNPAKIIKDVSDEMIEWKTEGTKIYQQLPKDCFNGLKEVEPLREIPADRKVQDSGYKTWKENQ